MFDFLLVCPLCYHGDDSSQHALTFCPAVAYSVSTAAHSETQDRYERLTSVSSSVDFEQRDNVRTFVQARPERLFVRLLADSCAAAV